MLRHSFAATAAEMGFSELTIAGLLGHSVPGVTARYAHVPDTALVAAADRVAARIASALDGKAEAEVVPLRRERRAMKSSLWKEVERRVRTHPTIAAATFCL